MSGALLPQYGVQKAVCFGLHGGSAPLGKESCRLSTPLGREVEAEQGQRALPWRGGGGAFLVTFFHPKGVSQDRWPEVEMSVGPGVLCPRLEGWLSWSGSAGSLSPKLFQGSESKSASSYLS